MTKAQKLAKRPIYRSYTGSMEKLFETDDYGQFCKYHNDLTKKAKYAYDGIVGLRDQVFIYSTNRYGINTTLQQELSKGLRYNDGKSRNWEIN